MLSAPDLRRAGAYVMLSALVLYVVIGYRFRMYVICVGFKASRATCYQRRR